MTQYAEARAAQLVWLLPQLNAECERLKNATESTITGRTLGDRGLAILGGQADEISHAIERLSA
uniref:Uncharacterized protein n=1 Tax=Candidatus Methanogaster sp. ANME-2c ERB4 TaxID=2759911 RepID=A0A7G9Y269_9EURY|nr:hypothetical protein CIDILJJO_00010 [Methanosarcinales archaeon ANME-2c ERB4]QNO42103.1 hypothetical protein INBEEEIC_00005 [Methanosarcinales archaeon ANME-2c ERB4]QNO42307.1 hypothetical protein OEDCDHIP_00024 [Methanosarcinales archaeon ANME-2c ERB4]QNO42469.1 hypothetical protein LBOOMNCC_00022 [Methanosarcinales archaeon ANME-2c ERB4]QNO42707.1 hypothetical protein AOABALHP_00010 [Methanosarcinales archaeon ANME-2c ERB4]